MVTLIVRHKVEDFDTWQTAFRGFAELNARYVGSNAQVYRALDDLNDVTVMHDFPSIEAVQAMLASEEVQAAMGEAGVVGPPSVLIAEKVA